MTAAHAVALGSLLLAGCTPPPEAIGGSGTTDAEPTTTASGDATMGPPPADTTGVISTGSGGGSDSSGEPPGTDTGPLCDPGTADCVCDGGQCMGDLVCDGDVCVAPGVCGDGRVGPGEDCDDGNAETDDGCEGDCTFSPGVAAVSLGVEHTCALLHRRAVRCWGFGADGRLGYGDTSNIGDNETPADAGDVDLGGPAVEIAVGSAFSCARLEGGTVRCWGANAAGQLGLEHTASVGDMLVPSELPVIELGGDAIAIAVGADHACALLDGGDLRCWGDGASGALGYGDTANIGDDETPASAGSVPVGGPAVAIAAGDSFSCALLGAGDVRCWGEGTSGRLGNGNGSGDIGDDEFPETVAFVDVGAPVVELALGEAHVCARTNADDVLCWGEANLGRLGYGDTSDVGLSDSPVDVGPVSLGASASGLGLGRTHSCAILPAGEVRCWGEATNGRIGNGDAALDVGDDEVPSDVPVVDVGAAVRSIDGGGAHTCAVLVGSGVRCWGRSNRGQLGYGNTDSIGDDELPSAVGLVVVE